MIRSVSQSKLWEVEKIFRTVNLRFEIKIYLCMKGLSTSQPSVLYFTDMNEIVKIVIQFKNVIQNIQRNLDQTLNRKERICPILDHPAHFL